MDHSALDTVFAFYALPETEESTEIGRRYTDDEITKSDYVNLCRDYIEKQNKGE